MKVDAGHYQQRSRLAFFAAAAALASGALILLAIGESEWPMFVLGLVGLLAGRASGVPDRHLAVIALGLSVFAWPIALIDSPIVSRATSTLGHILLAAMLAWVVADPVRHRWQKAVASPWSPRWFLIPALVLVIGAVWELGEWLGDALFDSDLALRPFDTAGDVFADFAGAVVGLAIHDRASVGASAENTSCGSPSPPAGSAGSLEGD
jgi:hypothetical protein